MTFDNEARYEMYVHLMEKELLEHALGIGRTSHGMYDSKHVLWPVALYLVRISFEDNPGILTGYGRMADDLLRLSNLSDVMDWFAENSRSRVDNGEEHWVAIADE